ncbi:hydrogen peroxide-dependent heme synthase [Actinospica robiniae]|uniref:hydrogen peroxide-dependent heme synthase n=1 Tax=Actinospica robiniae TaxID=304901 RepID=UPI0003F8998B|nr:hydrogen peroxide-dependent heme synthase [Actinospica robiniae]
MTDTDTGAAGTSAVPPAATAAAAESAPGTTAPSTERPVSRKARELNDEIRYTSWSVFKAVAELPEDEGLRIGYAEEVLQLFTKLAADRDVVVRGTYDTAGLRADADLMIWAHGPTAEALQELYSSFRKTLLGQCCEPVWSSMALHRPAEFNKSHIPAYLAGEAARDWACVYPFVRSYEWYLLPDEERRALLAEHGKMSREYPDVRANTVPAFALGDYEWLLCFEANDLHRIVDLMRHLRGSETRRHVRVEIPFYTGRRKPLEEIVRVLP